MEAFFQCVQSVGGPNAFQDDFLAFICLPGCDGNPSVTARYRKIGAGGFSKGHPGGILKAHEGCGKIQVNQIVFMINPDGLPGLYCGRRCCGGGFVLLGFRKDQGNGQKHQQGSGEHDLQDPDQNLTGFLSVCQYATPFRSGIQRRDFPPQSIIYGAEERCQMGTHAFPVRFGRRENAGFYRPDSFIIQGRKSARERR